MRKGGRDVFFPGKGAQRIGDEKKIPAPPGVESFPAAVHHGPRTVHPAPVECFGDIFHLPGMPENTGSPFCVFEKNVLAEAKPRVSKKIS